MEIPRSNMTPSERLKLLRQDKQLGIYIGIRSRITNSPQRPVFWDLIKQRRAEILNSPDPQAVIDKTNREIDGVIRIGLW